MISSWWELAEWAGQSGGQLNLRNIECPFCFERGNFSLSHHAEKKKPNSDKKLNFDTYKCENCAGYVLVFWTASEFGYDKMHDYRVIPFPLKINQAPEHWPGDVQRFWLQSRRNLQDENWDAASLMARSALQVALRDNNAIGKNLKQEIDDLANKGILPPIMKDWSNNIRELGNDSAHPIPGQPATTRADAKDVVQFLDFLLEYLYTLPKNISDYRKRRESKS